MIWTDEQFLEAIKLSQSHSEAAKKLGYSSSSGLSLNSKSKYAKYFNRLNPNISHFSLRSRGNSIGQSGSEHTRENEAELLFVRYQNSAKQKGREFSLTREEFVKLVTSTCFYCGSDGEQKNTGRRKSKHKTCGIDRINSEIGYISNNVVPCCWICNQWKRAMPISDFINHVKNISNKMGL